MQLLTRERRQDTSLDVDKTSVQLKSVTGPKDKTCLAVQSRWLTLLGCKGNVKQQIELLYFLQ